jgi:parvulin-like peptidyl-prolyl isomerase
LAAAAFKLSSENPFPEAPVRGEKGFFVFRFLDHRIPDVQSDLAEIDSIKEQLRQRKQMEVYRNWMAQARSRTEIEIDHSLLK